jgi:hypothetical protein
MAMRDLWYVKARNVQTGEEIQRIAALGDGAFGSPGAESQMKAYLVETGRAASDLAHWVIVEVHRVGNGKDPLSGAG